MYGRGKAHVPEGSYPRRTPWERPKGAHVPGLKPGPRNRPCWPGEIQRSLTRWLQVGSLVLHDALVLRRLRKRVPKLVHQASIYPSMDVRGVLMSWEWSAGTARPLGSTFEPPAASVHVALRGLSPWGLRAYGGVQIPVVYMLRGPFQVQTAAPNLPTKMRLLCPEDYKRRKPHTTVVNRYGLPAGHPGKCAGPRLYAAPTSRVSEKIDSSGIPGRSSRPTPRPFSSSAPPFQGQVVARRVLRHVRIDTRALNHIMTRSTPRALSSRT